LGLTGTPMKTFCVLSFILILASLSITGCKKNNVIKENQHILFQYDYINYAWGYLHTGFFIDNLGNIHTYKNPQNWNYPDEDLILTESQLHENLEYCLTTGEKISFDELEKYAGYIKNISLSKITALKNVAADAGTGEYICYVYSDTTGTYKGSLIKMEGDFTCENLNFYSKRVMAWLKGINDTLKIN
jgi:hypothetical protein